MPTSQRIVQVCLFLIAAIAMLGGTLQMEITGRDFKRQRQVATAASVRWVRTAILIASHLQRTDIMNYENRNLPIPSSRGRVARGG